MSGHQSNKDKPSVQLHPLTASGLNWYYLIALPIIDNWQCDVPQFPYNLHSSTAHPSVSTYARLDFRPASLHLADNLHIQPQLPTLSVSTSASCVANFVLVENQRPTAHRCTNSHHREHQRTFVENRMYLFHESVLRRKPVHYPQSVVCHSTQPIA